MTQPTCGSLPPGFLLSTRKPQECKSFVPAFHGIGCLRRPTRFSRLRVRAGVRAPLACTGSVGPRTSSLKNQSAVDTDRADQKENLASGLPIGPCWSAGALKIQTTEWPGQFRDFAEDLDLIC